MLTASEAALQQGVSAVTARKWLGRYVAGGATALLESLYGRLVAPVKSIQA